MRESGGEEDETYAWSVVALVLGENGWTGDAVYLLEEVLQIQKNKLGEDHPDTLQSMGNLASRYSEAGRWTEALALSEQVLQLRKNKLGDDHPDTLLSMHSLAIEYSEAGRRTEALTLSEQVLQLRKSKLGDDHPDTLQSMQLCTSLIEKRQEASISTAKPRSRHGLSKLWHKLRS